VRCDLQPVLRHGRRLDPLERILKVRCGHHGNINRPRPAWQRPRYSI
jgi:hypothetical protein